MSVFGARGTHKYSVFQLLVLVGLTSAQPFQFWYTRGTREYSGLGKLVGLARTQ